MPLILACLTFLQYVHSDIKYQNLGKTKNSKFGLTDCEILMVKQFDCTDRQFCFWSFFRFYIVVFWNLVELKKAWGSNIQIKFNLILKKFWQKVQKILPLSLVLDNFFATFSIFFFWSSMSWKVCFSNVSTFCIKMFIFSVFTVFGKRYIIISIFCTLQVSHCFFINILQFIWVSKLENKLIK